MAANREAAFAALKARGIRPGRVVEAPGLMNYLLGRKWTLCGVIFLVVVVLAAFVFSSRAWRSVKNTNSIFEDSTRRQIIGDATRIEKGMLTGWDDVFVLEGDRFLAGFAIPGVPVAVRSVKEASLRDALSSRCLIDKNDPIEVRQIKSIVEGMKQSINGLVGEGWTLAEVGTALVRRQEKEIEYYNIAKREIEATAKNKNISHEDMIGVWEKWNASLRQMGIRQVPLPE